jgi:hypothetical protein
MIWHRVPTTPKSIICQSHGLKNQLLPWCMQYVAFVGTCWFDQSSQDVTNIINNK